MNRPSPRLQFSALLLGLLLPLSVSSCGKKTLEDLRANSSELNVVLITVDSICKSHLELYGYEALSTPNLSKLAAEGVLFKDAVTASPVSLPSHASIHTGLYPPLHGARHTGTHRLPEKIETLAETFQDAGVATGAFLGSATLNSSTGLAQGFETYDDQFKTPQGRVGDRIMERKATTVMDPALQFIRREVNGRFFAWIHFADARYPYQAPERFIHQAQSGVPFFRAYDSEIAYIDFEVGRLLKRLEDLGIRDRTMIAFVGANGEGFGPQDHNEPYHGTFLYEATTAVPMILNCPEFLPDRVSIEEVASTVDLVPTILDATALLKPGNKLSGRSHLPLIFGDETAKDPDRAVFMDTLYPLIEFGWSPLYAIRTSQYKMIGAPFPELYDVKADPGETRNLIEVQEALGTELLRRLVFLIGENGLQPQLEEEATAFNTESRRWLLEKLGYLGEIPPIPEAPLWADPKQRVLLYVALIEAERQFNEGQDEKRLEEAINFVLNAEGASSQILLRLGRILLNQGDRSTALTTFQKAVDADPAYASARHALAKSQLQNDLPREALETLDVAKDLDPRSSRIFSSRGDALLALFRPEEAEESYRKAITLDALCYPARSGLARTLAELERPDEGIEIYQSILRNRPNDVDSILGQAELFEATNDIDKALRNYAAAFQAIKNASNKSPYLRRLADAMLRHKKYPAARELLSRLSNQNPQNEDLHFELIDLLVHQFAELPGAIKRLDLLLQMDEENVRVRARRARILMMGGGVKEATKEVAKCLELDGSDPESLVVQGLIELEQKKQAAALASFEKAAQNDKTGDAQNQLAWLLLTSEDESIQDVKRAVATAKEAVLKGPDQFEYADTLVRALVADGQGTEASSTCQAFIENHPGDPRIHSTLGDIQKANKEIDNAVAAYRKSAELYQASGRLRKGIAELELALGLKAEDQDLIGLRDALIAQRAKSDQARAKATSKKTPGNKKKVPAAN